MTLAQRLVELGAELEALGLKANLTVDLSSSEWVAFAGALKAAGARIDAGSTHAFVWFDAHLSTLEVTGRYSPDEVTGRAPLPPGAEAVFPDGPTW